MSEETKVCNRCGVEKKIDHFFKRSGCNKYRGLCKECINTTRNKHIAFLRTAVLEKTPRATKICSKCKRELPISLFRKNWLSKDGYGVWCKRCTVKYGQIKQKEIIEYNRLNKKEILSCVEGKIKKCSICKKDKLINEYHINMRSVDMHAILCKECESKRSIKRNHYQTYTKQHNKLKHVRDRKNERCRRYRKERRKSDACFKLVEVLRSRIKMAIKNNAKRTSSLVLLGAPIIKVRCYLESLFIKGMGWYNHGTVWHIDHRIPCAAYDLTKEDEQKKCFHYTNLRPLLKKDNLSKNAKISLEALA